MSSALRWILLVSYEVDKIQRKINSMWYNKQFCQYQYCHGAVFTALLLQWGIKTKMRAIKKSQLAKSRKRTTEVKLIGQSLIFTVNHCCYVATGSQPSSSLSLHTSAARHLPPLPNIDLQSIPSCTTVKLQQILLNLSNKSVWRSLNCKAVLKDWFFWQRLWRKP